MHKQMNVLYLPMSIIVNPCAGPLLFSDLFWLRLFFIFLRFLSNFFTTFFFTMHYIIYDASCIALKIMRLSKWIPRNQEHLHWSKRYTLRKTKTFMLKSRSIFVHFKTENLTKMTSKTESYIALHRNWVRVTDELNEIDCGSNKDRFAI